MPDSGCGWGTEQLERDVVGIAKRQDRAVELVDDARLRERAISSVAALDAVVDQVVLPPFKFLGGR